MVIVLLFQHGQRYKISWIFAVVLSFFLLILNATGVAISVGLLAAAEATVLDGGLAVIFLTVIFVVVIVFAITWNETNTLLSLYDVLAVFGFF